MMPISLSPTHLRMLLLGIGIVSLLVCLMWPRDQDGRPKKGYTALVLGLILAIAIAIPGRSLRRKEESVATAQLQQEEEKCREVEEDLKKSQLELQKLTVELESLRNSASLERRIDAEREAADHKALLEMAANQQHSGDVLKLYFDESRSGLTFDTGSKELTCNAREKLAKIAIYLREERNLEKITIVGHTDNTPRTGDPNFNQRLSEARAIEVANYLQNAGVASSLLVSRGVADRQPAGFDTDQPPEIISSHNLTDQQKASNRRVEVDIQSKAKS